MRQNIISKNSLQSVKVVILALALSVGIAMAWTGPTQPPPNGNAEAPINVSSASQEKSGYLSIGKSSQNPLASLEVWKNSTDGGVIWGGALGLSGDANVGGNVTIKGLSISGPTYPAQVCADSDGKLILCQQQYTGNTFVDITNNGTETITVPYGVSSMSVKLWGAGGSGGGVYFNKNNTCTQSSGGGGGGGGYTEFTMAVNHNDTFNYIVGYKTGNSGGSSSSTVTSVTDGIDGVRTVFWPVAQAGGTYTETSQQGLNITNGIVAFGGGKGKGGTVNAGGGGGIGGGFQGGNGQGGSYGAAGTKITTGANPAPGGNASNTIAGSGGNGAAYPFTGLNCPFLVDSLSAFGGRVEVSFSQ